MYSGSPLHQPVFVLTGPDSLDKCRKILIIILTDTMKRTVQRDRSDRSGRETEATVSAQPDRGSIDYSLFKVGNELFAVILDEITEVLHDVEIEKVDHLSGYYCGTIRYRGITLPVVDTGKVLSHARYDDRIETCLLIKGPEGVFGIMVDSDVEIIRAQPNQVHQLPDCYSLEETAILNGILVRGDDFYGILNTAAIYAKSKTKEV